MEYSNHNNRRLFRRSIYNTRKTNDYIQSAPNEAASFSSQPRLTRLSSWQPLSSD